MSVVSTTGLTATGTTTGTSSSSSLQKLGEDYTKILTLLTAQIKHQDPLSPMDSTEFVAQLAQLSQVEQAVKSNSNLEVISSKIAALATATGTDMIGRDVTVSSKVVELDDKSNKTFYRLTTEASSVDAEIVGPLGTPVRSLKGLSGKANTDIVLVWDGLDNSRNPALDGNYTVSFTAKDSTGKVLPVEVFRKAKVEEVLLKDGSVSYNLSGDETVDTDAFTAIR
jgi:flagellar basal-body rod modification protein FlgD